MRNDPSADRTFRRLCSHWTLGRFGGGGAQGGLSGGEVGKRSEVFNFRRFEVNIAVCSVSVTPLDSIGCKIIKWAIEREPSLTAFVIKAPRLMKQGHGGEAMQEKARQGEFLRKLLADSGPTLR